MNKYFTDLIDELKNKGSEYNLGMDSALATLRQLLNKESLSSSSAKNANNMKDLHQPNIPGSPQDTTKQNEIDEISKKAQEIRDSTQDIIDDNDNRIDQKQPNKDQSKQKQSNEKQPVQDEVKELAQEIQDQAEKLSDQAKNETSQKNIDDINKKLTGLQKRIQDIKDFWDDPENLKEIKADIKNKINYRKIQQEIKNAKNFEKNRKYKAANISQIVRDIQTALKTDSSKVRDSSYRYYNPRSTKLGYIAPGRFWNDKPKIPKLCFYFDYSSSWSGDKEKIDMGERIYQALIDLDKKKVIELTRFYFADSVSTNSNSCGSGNSDAPFPHIQTLLNANEIDNLIIMTDSDPQPLNTVTIPGRVWLLFYDTENEAVIEHTKTKVSSNKKIYMIEH